MQRRYGCFKIGSCTSAANKRTIGAGRTKFTWALTTFRNRRRFRWPTWPRYPRMKIVQLHCWPFLKEAGWLAKYHANIFIDTCWQPVLSPAFFREAMVNWLNYVPASKIMCSHDSTSVEMAVGSSLFTREILADTLLTHANHQGLTENDLRGIATGMLHDNAAVVYDSSRHP